MAAFPNACLAGCYFHIDQTILRKAKESGLQKLYNQERNTTLREGFHVIFGLPFVPVQDVTEAFTTLRYHL